VSVAILIVEDEAEIAELIRHHVDREGFRGSVVHSGRLALESIRRRAPDLVILDLMLPDLDGLEVCRRLRYEPQTRNLPILILSARGEEADIVAGIELGADDYVTKPFSPRVLTARIRNLLRRREVKELDGSIRQLRPGKGGLVIDLDRHTVEVQGRAVELTPTEFGILECLAGRPGFVRTRDQVIASVHGESTVLSQRAVDVHIAALRKKLGDYGSMIETVRGIGYRLRDAPEG
jgi:two-component system phosphate regulon response regulator PhoB